jgi:hypothetical protein
MKKADLKVGLYTSGGRSASTVWELGVGSWEFVM